MKNLLLLFAIPLFLISCVRDNDEDNKIGDTVNLDLDLSLSFTLEKTGESNKRAGITNKFSEFNHIFKDEVDLVFTSTTTDFTTTLTITPNDLSNTPTLVIPYGTYSWSIDKETFDYENDDYFKSYLSIFGSGQVEIYSSEVSLDLVVDTNYSLVTVEKENVSSAKLILDPPLEKDLILRGNYYYLYAFSFPEEYSSILQNRGYALEVQESVYNTSISVNVGENQTFYPKIHYNYILAFSDLDVNSITLKTAAFEQIDYYLQPTGTASCTLSFDVYIDSWVSTQSNGILTLTTSPSVEITPILYRLSSTCSSTTLSATITGLPEGLTMTYDGQNVATISGTPSAQTSGTYTYTLTGYDSNIIASVTSSITLQGIISITVTPTNNSAKTYIPDNVFEQYLIDNGYDDVLDDYVTTSNISSLTEINIQINQGVGVENMTGLEDFVSLERLTIKSNDLEALVIPELNNLEYVYLYECFNLIEFGFESELPIEELLISSTNIRSLDLSKLPSLKHFSGSGNPSSSPNFVNPITSLDFSSNPEIISISAHTSKLSSLNIDGCTKLNRITLFGTDLSGSLDISNIELYFAVSINNTSINCLQVRQDQLDLTEQFLNSNVKNPEGGVGYLRVNTGTNISLNCQ